MRKLTHEELLNRQKPKGAQERLPFVVLLNNIRSLYNVGSIFRSADGAGVAHIYLCGITGYPPSEKIAKTALGAQAQVPWSYHQDIRPVVAQLKAQGYEITMLEQTDESIAFEQYTPQPPTALVVGNEIEGVSSTIVGFCDKAVEIEMEGVKNSLNVSVAFGIVAFHIKNSIVGATRRVARTIN